MPTSTWKHGLHFGCAAFLTLTVACADDGQTTDDGASDGASESETAASGDGDGDAGDGDGDAGDGDGDTGDGDGDAGDGDGDTGDGDGDTGDGDGDTGDGDGDGDGDCVALADEAACDADPNCQSVIGGALQPSLDPNSPACVGPNEFLGCIPMMGCGDAPTWFCEGNSMWLVIDTCGPDGAQMCDAPPGQVGPC